SSCTAYGCRCLSSRRRSRSAAWEGGSRTRWSSAGRTASSALSRSTSARVIGSGCWSSSGNPPAEPSYNHAGGVPMGLFVAFFGFVAVCVVAMVVFAAAALAIKVAFHLILLPFKLILLPILAIALIIKLAVLFVIGAVIIALLIPLAILALIFVGP